MRKLTTRQSLSPIALLGLFAACLLSPSIALADGLLYQMPKDGAWVKYDMTMDMQAGDAVRTMTGTIRMAAVGTVKENDKTFRWIEFHMVMKMPGQDDAGEERTSVAKVLIPEEQLKKGGKPMDNWARGWLKQGDDSPITALAREADDGAGEPPLGGGLEGWGAYVDGSGLSSARFQANSGAPFKIGECA
jgi:hypothetical protein